MGLGNLNQNTKIFIEKLQYAKRHNSKCWRKFAPGTLSTYYSDVKRSAMTSQITGVSIVYSTVCSAQTKENIKAPRHWPLLGEFTGDRRISRTKGQWRGKYFNLMASSCGLLSRIVGIVLYCLHVVTGVSWAGSGKKDANMKTLPFISWQFTCNTLQIRYKHTLGWDGTYISMFFMQVLRNSCVSAMELRLFWALPSIFPSIWSN